MALQTIAPPGNRYMAPNTNETSERGENYADLLNKAQAMFTELYGRTGGSASLSPNGLTPRPILLVDALTPAGIPLAVAAAAGTFGISLTAGTSIGLTSEAAAAGTKTDVAVLPFLLPGGYVAGQNITVTVNANSGGAGTPTTQSVQAKAFKVANNGTMGADLIGASAATITSASADYTFTIPGTGLTPGTLLLLSVTAVIANAASSNTISVNSVRVS